MNNFYHKLNLDYNMQELIDVADNYDSEFMDGRLWEEYMMYAVCILRIYL